MANEPNTVVAGVLGNLPPWPRKAVNNSVVAAEQTYRKRKGLPLLTEEDMAALKAGEPMPWEREAAGLPAAAPAAPAAAAAAPAPPAAGAPAGEISKEVAEWAAAGKKWSRSSIAAEQARRKRNNLAPLNDAEITLLTGEAPAAAAPAPAAAAAPVAAAAPPSGTISAEVAEWVKAGKKWSRSSIAAEQARRKRNNLVPLNDAEIYALTGEAPGAPAAPAAAAPAKPAASVPARAAAAPAAVAGSAIRRDGPAVKYVGTPAVGTSQAAAAGGVASVGPMNSPVNQRRRRLVWTAVIAFLGTWLLAFFRFFLPRTLFEPSTVFKIGYPSDYGFGVDTKFQSKYRIWVDRVPGRIFVIFAKCTHLGCTPDWKPAENKFKCPCHGSGYDSEGINFEGPAPRPMDRAHVELGPDGQIIVDVSRLYQWPKGQASHFDDPGAFLSA